MAVVKLTTANFDQEVLQADRPVLVDFYADWCGQCKMMGPVVEEISGELDDVKVCKINIDEEMEVNGNVFRRKKMYAFMIRYVTPVMMAVLFLQSAGIFTMLRGLFT